MQSLGTVQMGVRERESKLGCPRFLREATEGLVVRLPAVDNTQQRGRFHGSDGFSSPIASRSPVNSNCCHCTQIVSCCQGKNSVTGYTVQSYFPTPAGPPGTLEIFLPISNPIPFPVLHNKL